MIEPNLNTLIEKTIQNELELNESQEKNPSDIKQEENQMNKKEKKGKIFCLKNQKKEIYSKNYWTMRSIFAMKLTRRRYF